MAELVEDRKLIRLLPNGATLISVPEQIDPRGSLAAWEFLGMPFLPQRFFAVYGVPSLDVRGEHAHRACHQLLVAFSGSVSARVDDGIRQENVVLNAPTMGLYMPPMTWGTQYGYSAGAVLGVFASHPYNADDYIRDYRTFLTDVL